MKPEKHPPEPRRILCCDSASLLTVCTVLEFLITLLVLGGLAFTTLYVFDAALRLDARPIYQTDEYTYNIAYRRLEPSTGLVNKTDFRSIMSQAYAEWIPDVKGAVMGSLAGVATAWAALFASIVGIRQKRPWYLIPRLIWQCLAILGLSCSIVLFSLFAKNVGDRRGASVDPNYRSGAELAMTIFGLYVCFSFVGLLIEMLGLYVVIRVFKGLLEDRRRKDEELKREQAAMSGSV